MEAKHLSIFSIERARNSWIVTLIVCFSSEVELKEQLASTIFCLT
jgi:hypothetical protein